MYQPLLNRKGRSIGLGTRGLSIGCEPSGLCLFGLVNRFWPSASPLPSVSSSKGNTDVYNIMLSIVMCVYVWLCKCVCMAGASQKRTSALLELELQVVVSHRRCWELDPGLQQSSKCPYLRATSSAPRCLNHIGSSHLICTVAVSFPRC